MVFEMLAKRDKSHEQVIFCSNSETGLKGIIAIHSTALGPSLGGCRMYPYSTEKHALDDVLRLSEAMSYKAALAGLPLGGGKSVIIADPEKDKTPELLWSFGVHIESLKGRYIVAKDMGIVTEDLQYIGDQSSYVVGRPVQRGGLGDPSRSTAKGVYYGIKSAVKWKLKKDSLKGLRLILQGLGGVGSNLLELLSNEGMEIFVQDIKTSVIDEIKSRFPKVKVISEDEVFTTECDIFSPCSVGAIINETSLKTMSCSIVAGGANNQLSHTSIGKKLLDKHILYIPDFIINSGGLIYVSSYMSPKKSNEWIENKIQGISQTINKVCELSQVENVDTAQMALILAREKIKRSYLS
ncbi:MAG: leucine dehydrogenase [Bdellovibrionaceae bacterium]|nr:leucine dehydrogenase [Pseudobdellovibrionaceae bacterium]